jgi:general L-amino acid transport system permease protein
MASEMRYVRESFSANEAAPRSASGPVRWLRDNLFATPTDTVLTLLGLLLLYYIVPPVFSWAIFNATWTGPDRSVCATIAQGGIQPDGWAGACWAFVNAKLMIPRVPRKGLNAILLFGVFPVVAYFLLYGGFGLPIVETPFWGGLLVTLTLSFVGIAVSLPLGILLALGRRSSMPVIKLLCVLFIEIVRGIPLITVLFMASVMLPLFLPPGTNFDKFLRALIGISLFASAYMAEVVRGGLQAIPKGQFEAADALGLSYSRKLVLIILPQALKLVIPGIVNTFIGMFKDTSLVSIVSMFDLLGIVRQNFSDVNWATPQTAMSGLVFAGLVFWIFCFGMSRYSLFVERRLDRSHR